MKDKNTFPLVEFAILGFCLWLARDLPGAWRHSPKDHLAWLALLIWLTPPMIRLARAERFTANAYFLGAAIIVGSLGELSDYYFPGHIALAFAIAAWLPVSLRSAIWLITALAWMPALGWGMARFSGGEIIFSRLALALGGVVCVWPFKTMGNKT